MDYDRINRNISTNWCYEIQLLVLISAYNFLEIPNSKMMDGFRLYVMLLDY